METELTLSQVVIQPRSTRPFSKIRNRAPLSGQSLPPYAPGLYFRNQTDREPQQAESPEEPASSTWQGKTEDSGLREEPAFWRRYMSTSGGTGREKWQFGAGLEKGRPGSPTASARSSRRSTFLMVYSRLPGSKALRAE
jgi:hypothetical protein